jgi:hypothetical protein
MQAIPEDAVQEYNRDKDEDTDKRISIRASDKKKKKTKIACNEEFSRL